MITLLAAIAGFIIGFACLYMILRKIGRKKPKSLDVALIIVYLTFVAFMTTMIVMYWVKGSIPETFAVAVICALIGEVGCTTRITNTKTRMQERQWQKEDEKEGRFR